MPSDRTERLSPTSPRLTNTDATPPTRSITIQSPGMLSPSRALGGQNPHRMGRSHRDDQEARERQMQQDIESAMSMSRARSGSILGEPSPGVNRSPQAFFPGGSPIDENPFPMLSEAEEAEMDRARRSGFRDDDLGSDDGHERHREQRSYDRGEDDEGIVGRSMGSSGYDSHRRLLIDDGSAGRGGVGGGMGGGGSRMRPDGMPQPARNAYDFAAMEEFAAQEREKQLGGMPSGSPADGMRHRRSTGAASEDQMAQHPGSYDTEMERTNTMSAFGDEPESTTLSPKETDSAQGHQSFHRRRQRKLSQSNPVMRRGGRLALFEGIGSHGAAEDGAATGIPAADATGPVAYKARAPKNPLSAATGNGFAPYTDAPAGHDRPYRFSFYSNNLPVTIHARTLAELPAEGQSFEDLFKGRATMDETRGSAAEGSGLDKNSVDSSARRSTTGTDTPERDPNMPQPNGKMSLLARAAGAAATKGGAGGGPGPTDGSPDHDPEAFTWWMDVHSPTDEEMRMLSKVFGIHPLTTEDILLEETREKIELFRNYYLVCFRSFDQDPYSQTYLEPLNMYIIVFREGTLSFHFRGTPHPQNVRRRIKQLKDYISVTSDWISYALIDDITDAFGPLIQSIEYEVDSIDELVLIIKDAEQSDMLRRIGTCRKKVMGLLRLMGNKADVVKGLAKRCNEQWLVAPKSDIGLYLSDIQDHLITMTQNLNHYEKILSRSHSNYLAQISIEMTDANNQINDVLSKLTALGTVLIPMNLVTGLWGMNVHVPGQDIETGYTWFLSILGGLCAFAILGAFATYKCFVTR